MKIILLDIIIYEGLINITKDLTEIAKHFTTFASNMGTFVIFSSSFSTTWTKSLALLISNFDNLFNVVLVLCSLDVRTCSFSSVNLCYLFLSQIADVSGVIEVFSAHKTSSFPADLVFAVKQSGVVLAAPDFKIITMRTVFLYVPACHWI